MGQIAVIGAAETTPEEYDIAQQVGQLIAGHREILVCGGLGGVMEAACKGAKEQDGRTIGIVPDTGNGNQFLDVVIRTGIGHARNILVAQSSDAVIAIGGSYGTLSEISIALKTKRRVFGIKTWDIEGVIKCTNPEDAVIRAVNAAHRFPLYRSPQDVPESRRIHERPE